ALGCATLAIVGGRMLRSILFGLVAAPFAALRGLPWVSRHLQVRRRDGTPAGLGRRTLWAIAFTILLTAVFGALLPAADPVFSRVLHDLVPRIDTAAVARWIFLLILGSLTAVCAVYTLAAPPDLSEMDKQGKRSLGALEWGLPVGALVLLFGGFVGVQFTVL